MGPIPARAPFRWPADSYCARLYLASAPRPFPPEIIEVDAVLGCFENAGVVLTSELITRRGETRRTAREYVHRTRPLYADGEVVVTVVAEVSRS